MMHARRPATIVLFVIFANAIACAASAADQSENNSLPAYLMPFASKVDDEAWQHAAWSADFVWIDAGDPAPHRSHFKAIYDRAALHFMFEFESANSEPQPLDPNF